MNIINVNLGEELFRFTSHQEWVNKAQKWFEQVINTKVMKGNYLCVSQDGQICRIGKHFREAEERGAYPIVCYAIPY